MLDCRRLGTNSFHYVGVGEYVSSGDPERPRGTLTRTQAVLRSTSGERRWRLWASSIQQLLRGDGLYLSAPGYGFSRAWSRGAPRRPNTEFTEEDMNETLRQGKKIYEHYLDLECRINGPFKSLSHMHYYAEFLKELNRPEEACAVFEKAWEMRPSRTSWDQKAISSIGLSLAKAYYGLGRQIEAIDLLTTICDHDELAYGCTDKTSGKSQPTLPLLLRAEEISTCARYPQQSLGCCRRSFLRDQQRRYLS
jgi:tetratricopeptide (TPR) repeat protein